jgi:hypothetical protein
MSLPPGAAPATRAAPRPRRTTWVPRQHGAWAMLLLPLLLGVAASQPSPWQVPLGAAAVAGYLASAAIQAWRRARRPPELRAPIVVFGGAFALLGTLLVVAFPILLALLVVGIPATALVIAGARPGAKRELVGSLAQVALALLLVPAAAIVSEVAEVATVVALTAVAAGYLVGSVLVVRSVLRARDDPRFAVASVAFHLVCLLVAALTLPWAYAVLFAGLAARAAALPVIRARAARGPRPLRPIHVGIVEIVASVAVVVTAFLAPTPGPV